MTFTGRQSGRVIDTEVEAHIAWLQSGDCSPRTLYERRRLLQHLSEHADQSVTTLSREQVERWLLTAPSAATRSTYYQAVRAYYRWTVASGRRADDPMALIRRPKVPRRRPRPLSPDQVAAAMRASSPHILTMITLGYYAGLRCCEIADFRGECIDLDAEVIRVRGKGGHERDIPAHPAILLRSSFYPRQGWWFPSPLLGGTHVTAQSVSTAVSRTMQRAGVAGTAHCLRHSFGTNVYRANRDIRVAQDLLGHAFITTTQIYAQTSNADLVAAVSNLPQVA